MSEKCAYAIYLLKKCKRGKDCSQRRKGSCKCGVYEKLLDDCKNGVVQFDVSSKSGRKT